MLAFFAELAQIFSSNRHCNVVYCLDVRTHKTQKKIDMSFLPVDTHCCCCCVHMLYNQIAKFCRF